MTRRTRRAYAVADRCRGIGIARVSRQGEDRNGGDRVSARQRRRGAEAIRIVLALLPISAVVTFFLLVVDQVTVRSAADLQAVRYGLPLPWVEQDLSRYEPVAYPETVPFNWTRAWYDPIDTGIDGFALAADVAIVEIALLAAAAGVFLGLRRLRSRRAARPAATRREDGR